jgi:hypothetical protein
MTTMGKLRPESRAGVVLLLLLAVANGLFLYLVPGRAEPDYAWAIRPEINAAFLGAGYLAGTVATALVVFRTRSWRSLRALPLPLVVLSVFLLAATLIHADLFRWSYAPTWVWTVVYAAVPPIVGWLWIRQERRAGPPPAADPRLRGVRIASWLLGAVLLVVGGLLFAAPTAMADVWPWDVTSLLGRAIGAWYLLVACALLVCAGTLRRPHEAIIPYATLGAWTLLLLALPVLYPERVDGPQLVWWVAVQVALLWLACVALARGLPDRAAL